MIASEPRPLTDLCDDCAVDIAEIQENYMVLNSIWRAARGNHLLCVACLEARLGRTLTSDDFSHAPINQGIFGLSERLRDRIGDKVFLLPHQLPRALAIEAFLDQLGIGYAEEPMLTPGRPHDTAVRVTLRRDARVWTVCLKWASSTRAEAIERLVTQCNVLTLFANNLHDLSQRYQRHLRHRANQAERVLSKMLTPAERDRLDALLAVSSVD